MSRRKPAPLRRRAITTARPSAPLPDRFHLYELCAQAPERDVGLLAAIHRAGGAEPRILGEDFCGTAALSAAWARVGPKRRAVAVDHDAPTLARAHRHPRVRLVQSDVRAVREPCDLIAVLNFSIGEFRNRPDLVAYLRHARSRMPASGCFICDIYGGVDAFATGVVRQRFNDPAGRSITYLWEQRTADPFTGMVCNAMHFRIRHAGRELARFDDAFVYDWRLWSVPELRDAMLDAGFAATQVYPRRPDALDARGRYHILPIEDPTEAGDSFSVYIVGRVSG